MGLDFVELGHEVKDPEKTFGFIDLRAVLLDILDVKGAPMVDVEAQVTRFLITTLMPMIETHGKYGLLFLDELPQSAVMVSNSLSQLIYDRRIGADYFLPDGWMITAAGNRSQDGAATNKVGAHIYNRFANYELVPEIQSFKQYFLDNPHLDQRVLGYLQAVPDNLHNYTPRDIAFATLRKWVEVAGIVGRTEDPELREVLIAGEVGTGPALELEGFLRMHTQLTSWNEISTRPDDARVPDTGSEMALSAHYALVGIVFRNVDKNTLGNALAYMKRLPKEFGNVLAHDIIENKPDLVETIVFAKWREDNPELAI